MNVFTAHLDSPLMSGTGTWVVSTYESMDGQVCDNTQTLAECLNAYGMDAVTVQPDGSCTFELPA